VGLRLRLRVLETGLRPALPLSPRRPDSVVASAKPTTWTGIVV